MLLYFPVTVAKINPKCTPDNIMKNDSMTSIHTLSNAATERLRVLNPPVEATEKA